MSRRGTRRARGGGALCAVLLLLGHGALAAQRPAATIRSDSVTVGDPALLVLEVPRAEGESVRFPDTLALTGDLEYLGPASVAPEDRVPGIAAAAYHVTAWRPGEHALPAITVPVNGPEGTRTVRLEPPVLRVGSVLPSDTAGVEPRPPKDVLGPDRTILPALILLALLISAAIAIGRWWARRRASGRAGEGPAVRPAEAALAALDGIQEAGLLNRGEVKEYYARTTRVLRDYLNAVEPAWGAGLTTAEIDAQVDPGLRPVEKRELLTVLFRADRVKFARHRPAGDEPEALWRAARDWIVAHEEAMAERRRAAAAAVAEAAR